MKDIIEIRNIKKSYGDTIVLRDISTNIEKGKIYGLVGKNGAGKSTLLKLLVGLVKSDSGSIYYNGTEPRDDGGHLKDFGVLIEDATFYNGMNTEEILKIHCDYMGYYDRDEIDKIVQKLGLSALKNKKTKVLSKGEKQRLAIARALITKPKILLLDEPTIGLDPSFINIIRNIILKLNAENGTTVIISSHILTELELFVDKVLFLKDGLISENTSMREIQDNCGEYLELRVDSPSKASVILEKDLKIKNFRLLKGEILRLYATDIDCGSIVKIFSENGIEVFEFSKKKVSLHEYYLDIIEGGI